MPTRRFERVVTWLASWFFVPPVLVDEHHTDIQHHAIVIGSGGDPLKIHPRDDKTDFWDLLTKRHMFGAEFRLYLDRMMTHLRRRHDEGKCPNGVMIIIHGGNEAPRKTVARTCELYPEIERSGYYPIFINWDASLWRSYVQHLLLIRSGMYDTWAWIWFLFHISVDILRGLILFPPALWLYFRLLNQSRRKYQFDTTKNLNRYTAPHLKQEGPWPGGLTVSRKRAFASFPVQLAALFLTGAGVPRAWENLLRRTRAMFRAPWEFELKTPPFGWEYQDCGGAVAVFLRELASTVRQYKDMKVTVLAHSMGSMIANDALQYWCQLPEIAEEAHDGHGFHINAIVYMAPACSVRSFAAAVTPILETQKEARAYVLTLHPRLEAAQRDFRRLIAGSALEWLEGALTTPHSYLDRMLGKWDNALRTMHIYRGRVRERLHFKSFAYNEEHKVCSHSDFFSPDLDPPFWTREFWWEKADTQP